MSIFQANVWGPPLNSKTLIDKIISFPLRTNNKKEANSETQRTDWSLRVGRGRRGEGWGSGRQELQAERFKDALHSRSSVLTVKGKQTLKLDKRKNIKNLMK